MEKHDLYKDNIDRYNRAKKEGYDYERLIILNNLLEDIISIILVHLGIVSSENRRKMAKKFKPLLSDILKIKENQSSFSSFRKKIDSLINVLNWSIEHNPTDCDSKENSYNNDLIRACHRILEYDEIEEVLLYLKNEWIPSRNEITHALLFRDKIDVKKKLECILNEGYKKFKYLDKVSKAVKRYKIVKKYNIQ